MAVGGLFSLLDDIASTLDHVTSAFGKEAAEGRQVVIFTHNLLFFNEVISACAQQSPQVKVLTHYVSSDESKGFGVVHANDSPWVVKKVKDRLHIIRSKLPILRAMPNKDTDEYRMGVTDFYTSLRETWERVVEEILLNGVVERFGSDVQTMRVKGVFVTDEDYQKIYFCMKRASERSGHDTSAAKMPPMPTVDVMQADIDELAAYVETLKERIKGVETARREREKPPQATTIG